MTNEATVDLPLPGFVTSATNLVVEASCRLADNRGLLLLCDPHAAPHFYVATVSLTAGLPEDGATRRFGNLTQATRHYGEVFAANRKD